MFGDAERDLLAASTDCPGDAPRDQRGIVGMHLRDFEEAIAKLARAVPTLVVTRSEDGAIAVSEGERASVPAQPIARLVDTTGAGDLFAAGFLAGQAQGLALEASLKLGAIAAAEVIQHYGARPEKDLRALSGDIFA